MKKSQKFNLKKKRIHISSTFHNKTFSENYCTLLSPKTIWKFVQKFKNSIFRTIIFAKMGYFTGFFGKKQSENFHENIFFCGNAKFWTLFAKSENLFLKPDSTIQLSSLNKLNFCKKKKKKIKNSWGNKMSSKTLMGSRKNK